MGKTRNNKDKAKVSPSANIQGGKIFKKKESQTKLTKRKARALRRSIFLNNKKKLNSILDQKTDVITNAVINVMEDKKFLNNKEFRYILEIDVVKMPRSHQGRL